MAFTLSDGDIRVFNPREPWDRGGTDYVQVHTTLEDIYGLKSSTSDFSKELYERAKFGGDYKSAYSIISRCISKQKLAALKELRSQSRLPLLFVYPRTFDIDDARRSLVSGQPTNALPGTLATFLCSRVGGQIHKSIRQTTIKKRTNLSRITRFIYQPRFRGYVAPGRRYVLVDDVISTGATFAALRSYIVRGGGLVVGMTALAHVWGRDQKLSITSASLQELKTEFGDGLEAYWEATFGHKIELITQQEANGLLRRWRAEHKEVASGAPLLGCLRGALNGGSDIQ